MTQTLLPAPPDAPHQTIQWQRLREGGGLFVFRLTDHEEIGRHDHVFHEIVFVESGTAEHETIEGSRTLRPGDVIIICPQVWHAYGKVRKLCIVNCLIDAPLMRRLGTLLTPIAGAFDLLRRRPRDPRHTPPTVLHATPAQHAAMREYLQATMAEQQAMTPGWQAAATASLLQLLVAVARLGAGQTRAAAPLIGDRAHQAVLQVATYLEAHFAESVSLQHLGNLAHLSAGHLSRSFSRHMGMGIVQYMHRMRAEEACRLLRCTDEPIARIAAKVGYDELAYFSRCFRSQIKQSPQQYRHAARGPFSTTANQLPLRQLAVQPG